MRRLIFLWLMPLCFSIGACGDDAPEPAVVSEADVAVVDAAPDVTAIADDDPASAASGTDAAPAADAPSDVPVSAPPATPAPATPAPAPAPVPAAEPERAEGDARDGTLEQALLYSGWRIVNGPGRTLYFESDGSYQMEDSEGVTDGGSWSAEGFTLFLGEDRAYVLDDRSATRISFDDGELVLEHID